MKKNILGSLKLIAIALVVASAYWLSYGMSDMGYRVSHAAEQARAQAEQKAKIEGKTSSEIKEAGRQAAIQTTKDVQTQLEQEYVARGRRPSVSRTQVATKPVEPETVSAAPKTESLVSWSPVDLAGERRFAVLIIDEQFDFMQIPFKENTLGKKLSDGKEDFGAGRLAVAGANQQFLDAQRKFLEACWNMELDRIFSQDWHKIGSVSFNTSYESKNDGTNPAAFAPLGANAGNYKAVGAAGSCQGVEKLSGDAETRKGQVAIIPEQVLWPKHCIQGTVGAEMPDMLFADGSYAQVKKAQPSVAPKPGVAPQGYKSSKGLEFIVEKGVYCHVDSYSALLDNDRKTKTELESIFVARGITDVWLKGIATDFCVGSSAVHTIESGRNVHMLVNLCRGVFADDAANPHVNMVKMVKRLAGLVGPNGARAYFYVIADLNDGDGGNIKTETLLKEAGVWDQTNRWTLADLMNFVKSLHGKKGGIEELLPGLQPILPTTPIQTVEAVKPAVSRPTAGSIEPGVLTAPVYLETPKEEPTEGYGESAEYPIHEELAARYKAQQVEIFNTPDSISDWKKLRDDELGYYVEMQDTKGNKYVFLALDEEGKRIGLRIVSAYTLSEYRIDGALSQQLQLAPVSPTSKEEGHEAEGEEEEEETPAPVVLTTPAATGRAAALAKNYEAQKIKDAPEKLLDFATSKKDVAGNYVEFSSGLKKQVFMKQPDGGYKIEFKDRQWQLDENGNVKSAGAPIASSSSSSSAHAKPAPTLSERYEAQKKQYASRWKLSGVDFQQSLDLDKLTEQEDKGSTYGSTSVLVGGPVPFVYKKTRSESGDQWMIEFIDAVYTYAADNGVFKSQRLLGPGIPTSKPAGVRTPTSIREVLATDPFASMSTPPATSSDVPSDVSSF